MLRFNESLLTLLKPHIFNSPVHHVSAFEHDESYLKEFLSILFDPLKGAENNLVEVWNSAEQVNSAAWTHSIPTDATLYRDVRSIKKCMDLKCSIVFDQYFKYSMMAKQLIALIHETLNCGGGCNAYLSQKGGKAFPIHRDGHHVLIFALSGQKRWKVYNHKQNAYYAQMKVPDETTDDEIRASGLALDIIMNPGDILYIPIGQFHEVENLSNHSLHLTASMVYKNLPILMSEILASMSSIKEKNASPELLSLLSQLHPAQCSNTAISKDSLIDSLKDVVKLMELVVRHDSFPEMHLARVRNRYLDILKQPSDDWLQEVGSIEG